MTCVPVDSVDWQNCSFCLSEEHNCFFAGELSHIPCVKICTCPFIYLSGIKIIVLKFICLVSLCGGTCVPLSVCVQLLRISLSLSHDDSGIKFKLSGLGTSAFIWEPSHQPNLQIFKFVNKIVADVIFSSGWGALCGKPMLSLSTVI